MAEVNGDSDSIRERINTERLADIQEYNAKIQKMSELMNQIGQNQTDLHQRFDRN